VISILAPLGYAALLFHSGSYDASALLRFPFLFVVSLFYGYFMQLVRTQKVLREQAEQKNRGKAEAQRAFPRIENTAHCDHQLYPGAQRGSPR